MKDKIINELTILRKEVDLLEKNQSFRRKPAEPTKPYNYEFKIIKKPNFLDLKGFGCGASIVLVLTLFINWVYFDSNYGVEIFFVLLSILLIYSLYQYSEAQSRFKKRYNNHKKAVADYEKKLKEYLLEKEKYDSYAKNKEACEAKKRAIQNKIKELYKYCSLDEKKTYTREFLRTEYYAPENTLKRRTKITSDNLLRNDLDIANFLISKTNEGNSDNKKVVNIIRTYSAICAGLAIQPLPFADIFILTPTQAIMGKQIADVRGYKITEERSTEIIKEIGGVIGLGVAAQQLVIGAYKTFLPFMGAVTTIPVVYGLTFGIGKVMDYYIITKKTGRIPDKNEMKKIFTRSSKEGKEEGEKRKSEIKNNRK
ncbi:YcjF family protein [Aestuariivivens sp. NBU2969]|uniref:YcjF family protein n=1 Tax=Aestuariivivens sp. NBU2969 TaxID=2873267 RepID=UPI001CC0E4FD|nr:hypothetical protein [Aestuariivivens sp. NBU2969]